MKNKLDAFKEKANAILMKDALLNVNGGQTDPDDCHPDPKNGNAYGNNKAAAGYTVAQVDRFFSNPDWATQFNSMYAPGDIHLAEHRMMFFDSIVSSWGSGTGS